MNDLLEEIRKILIFSNYEKDMGGLGKTAIEILDFENRAIDCYLGKNPRNLIIFNKFKARIDRDVALIAEAITRHPNKPVEPTTDK